MLQNDNEAILYCSVVHCICRRFIRATSALIDVFIRAATLLISLKSFKLMELSAFHLFVCAEHWHGFFWCGVLALANSQMPIQPIARFSFVRETGAENRTKKLIDWDKVRAKQTWIWENEFNSLPIKIE